MKNLASAPPFPAALLPARADGKSPVEYLAVEAREQVRAAARRILLAQPRRLRELLQLCRPLWLRAG